MPRTHIKIPAFSAPASTGQTIESDAYEGKLPMVLVFEPTEDLLTAFDRRLQDFGKRRSQVLAFAATTASDTRTLADRLGLSMPVLADPDRSIHRAFGIERRTEVVVADRSGTIVETFPVSQPDRAVEEALSTLSSLGD